MNILLWQHIPYNSKANPYRNHMKTLLTFGPLGCLPCEWCDMARKMRARWGVFFVSPEILLVFSCCDLLHPMMIKCFTYCAYTITAPLAWMAATWPAFFFSSAPHTWAHLLFIGHTHKFPLTCFQITCHYYNLSCALRRLREYQSSQQRWRNVFLKKEKNIWSCRWLDEMMGCNILRKLPPLKAAGCVSAQSFLHDRALLVTMFPLKYF